MEKITAFFDGMDFTKLVPEMDSLLDILLKVCKLSIIVGPIVMLAFGLMYFFIPPKEANHSVGFRTYFGMGSVEAWRFTQKLAGIAWGALGLILTVVMFIIRAGYAEKDIMAVAQSAATCLLWQAALAFFCYVGICGAVTILFDHKGNRRFGRSANVDETYEEPTEEPSDNDEELYLPQEDYAAYVQEDAAIPQEDYSQYGDYPQPDEEIYP